MPRMGEKEKKKKTRNAFKHRHSDQTPVTVMKYHMAKDTTDAMQVASKIGKSPSELGIVI